MAIRLSGIASGLDTDSMVKNLCQLIQSRNRNMINSSRNRNG